MGRLATMSTVSVSGCGHDWGLLNHELTFFGVAMVRNRDASIVGIQGLSLERNSG